MQEEYFAFSDEKGSGQERYWGVGVVSGPASPFGTMREALLNVLADCGIKSLEWKDIDGDNRCQRAAKGYINTAVHAACNQSLRIDVLFWDMQDSRHAVAGRDDMQNLEMMYYKLFVHCGRICNVSNWRLYPHKNSALDWKDIADYFQRSRVNKPKPYLLALFEENQDRFDIVELKIQDSKEEPLVQLADIFVGMGCFSVQKRDKLYKWIQAQKRCSQPVLIPDNDDDHDRESRAEQARFELINDLSRRCKAKGLGVSLETKGHLWTPKPRNPINFWLYEPQHDLDKAPTRGGG